MSNILFNALINERKIKVLQPVQKISQRADAYKQSRMSK